MSNVLVNDESLKAIADSIRSKNGSTIAYKPAEMAPAIAAIETGSAEEKPVKFYDFDGTVLHSYTLDEAHALTALPASPTHESDEVPLTCEGWNWTLEQVKACKYGADVGAMYHTTDGNLHMILDVSYTPPSYPETNDVNFIFSENATHVDYGDGTEEDIAEAGTKTHTYPERKKYHVGITDSSKTIDPLDFENSRKIEEIYFPNSVTALPQLTGKDRWDDFKFNHVQKICMPNSVKTFGVVFVRYGVSHLTIPNSLTAINTDSIKNCNNLESISLPGNLSKFDNYSLHDCTKIKGFTIPDNVTSIGNNTFQNCYSLQSVTIPDNVTSIGSCAFQNCSKLATITVHPATPPAIQTSVFDGIDKSAVIYIPNESYKTATNWSTYADKMVVYNPTA